MRLTTPQGAAIAILANTIVCKLYMSFGWRVQLAGMSPEEQKKAKAGPEYQKDSCGQLNEAEYAPVFLSCLFYMALQKIEAPITCGVSVWGCVG